LLLSPVYLEIWKLLVLPGYRSGFKPTWAPHAISPQALGHGCPVIAAFQTQLGSFHHLDGGTSCGQVEHTGALLFDYYKHTLLITKLSFKPAWAALALSPVVRDLFIGMGYALFQTQLGSTTHFA
jgi:hypothetical protein